MRRLLTISATALAVLAAAGPAAAHMPAGGVPTASVRALPAHGCPGDAIRRDRVIEGRFAAERQGSYVMVPFNVPRGTTAVRVKYCFDQPENRLPQISHTLDLGLYEARNAPDELWGPEEFRGWGGSSHPDVTVSPEGFSTEAQYVAKPKGHVPGKTTRGFRPGPIPAGEWAVELGLGGIAGTDRGDEDGHVAWRVEIELATDPSFADEPYRPAPYDARAVNSQPGWYAGDLHVHAEHSALGDATMRETFDFAFKPLAEKGAGLDFVMLSDYVTDTAWGEVGRHQGRYPGRMIGRSSEVITYRGHMNNHASRRYVDHRTGPVYQLMPDGSLFALRGARPARDVLAAIRAAGGATQVNHPTIFPSQVPGFDLFCRGCPWDYSFEETDYGLVSAFEVTTGPPGLRQPIELGLNPFTPLALLMYDRILGAGGRPAAVGVSDSHNAGRTRDALQAPIGTGTTMVYARELSERSIAEAVHAGHTYAKVTGNKGPDIRFDARAADGREAMMGDALKAGSAQFTARVLRGSGHVLLVLKDGVPIGIHPVSGNDATIEFASQGAGHYRLHVQNGTTITTVSSAIMLDPAARDRAPLSQVAERVRAIPGRVSARRATLGCAIDGPARTCTIRLSVTRRGRQQTVVRIKRFVEAYGQVRGTVRLNRRARSTLRRGRGRAILVASARAERGGLLTERRPIRVR